jgi:bifunctional DNA-binding transcriptional regulator/antitoxin component of YhaV-PrlF toxin-antitoxin module
MNLHSNLSHGRTIIPKPFRLALNLQDGDALIWAIRDDELVATTKALQIKRAQTIVAQCAKPSLTSAVNELIEERLAEAHAA